MSAQARCGIVGKKTLDMGDVRCLNKEKGRFFFSPDTLKFFDSQIESGLIKNKFFVTSEKPPHGGRSYTIRKFDRNTGAILKGSEFGEFSTKEKAITEAELLNGEG